MAHTNSRSGEDAAQSKRPAFFRPNEELGNCDMALGHVEHEAKYYMFLHDLYGLKNLVTCMRRLYFKSIFYVLPTITYRT